MKVGFIGLGLMGAPMSRNLLKAGHQVIALDRVAARTDQLVKEGAQRGLTPKQVAEESEVVITMVPDSPDVEEVALGSEGVVHGVRPGSTYIDMSTISPAVTRRISARLKEKGVPMLDAPVSGGVVGAINASLSIMVGGETDVFDRCAPLFQTMGKRITYCGPSGTGQVTKLVNNIIAIGTLAAACEGLVFAAKAGVDLETVLQAVSGGAAASWQLENMGPRILKGDFAPGFMIRLSQKDLRLILEAAQEMRLPLFTTPLIHQVYRALESEGAGEEGTQAYIKVLERLAGVQVRAHR